MQLLSKECEQEIINLIHSALNTYIPADHRKRWLTRKEACEYLNVSKSTIIRRVAEGLPEVKIGGRVQYDIHDLDQWMEERKL